MPRRYKWNAGTGDITPDFYEVGIPSSSLGPEVLFGTKTSPGTDVDPFVLPDGVAPYGTRNVAVRAVKQTGVNAQNQPVYQRTPWSNQIVQSFTMGTPDGFAEVL